MQRMIWMAAVVGMVCGIAGGADWVTPSEKGEGVWEVDFPGGSLADYYKGLNEAFDDMNFIVHPTANEVGMPAVMLDKMLASALAVLPSELISGIDVGESTGAWTEIEGGEQQSVLWVVKVDRKSVNSWRPLSQASHERSAHPHHIELIEFPGGTVGDFVGQIRAMKGEFNVVMMPGVESVQIPAMTLRDILWPNAVELLGDLKLVTGVPLLQVTDSKEAFVLQAYEERANEITREVWNLSELMASGIGEDGILRAVEMGLGSVGDGADVLYHEDTGLLLVVGTHDHVHVVEEILSEMHETAIVREHARMRAEENLREREELELEIQRFAAEIDVLQQRLVMQRETVQECQKLVDEGVMSGHEVREAKIELREFESQLEIRVREMQMLERRFKALVGATNGVGGMGDGVGA